jgi:hypothetical protein
VLTHEINPIACIHHPQEACCFNWRVADDFEQILVGPDVVLQWRNVEIANDDALLSLRNRTIRKPAFQFIDELQLMSKFFIDAGIGLVAAGRNIEIVDGDGFRPGEAYGNMAAILLAAKGLAVLGYERQA